jgi:hypothetical protein
LIDERCKIGRQLSNEICKTDQVIQLNQEAFIEQMSAESRELILKIKHQEKSITQYEQLIWITPFGEQEHI